MYRPATRRVVVSWLPWGVCDARARLRRLWQITTSKKLGLILPQRLPANWEHNADMLWSFSLLLNLAFTVVKWRRLDRSSAAYQRQSMLLCVTFFKYLLDLGQALPAAAKLETSPLFDSSCGLGSGLLSTYKIWVESRAK